MNDRTVVWMVTENVITLLLACGMTTLFFYWTHSGLSFLWLILLININTPRYRKDNE